MSDPNYVPPVPVPAPAPSDKKKYLWPVVAGVAVIALIVALVVGFTNRDSDEPSVAPSPVATVTETAKPTETPRLVPAPEVPSSIAAPTGQPRDGTALSDAGFLSLLREMYPDLKNVPDEDIMTMSGQVCDMLDEGATPEEIMVLAISRSDSAEEAEANGAIVGATVSNYCPEYSADFEAFLNEVNGAPVKGA